jgi:hypothetical protein
MFKIEFLSVKKSKILEEMMLKKRNRNTFISSFALYVNLS